MPTGEYDGTGGGAGASAGGGCVSDGPAGNEGTPPPMIFGIISAMFPGNKKILLSVL
jgi:hypothetical protein